MERRLARLRIILRERWDRKGEGRSLAGLRFNGNPPTMTIGDRLTDGELYSRPWIFGFVGEPFERLEDRLREFFLEADAIIDNLEAYSFLAHGSGGDVYLRRLAWFAVLDRVRNDILHQAGDLRPVRHDVYGS